MSNWKGHLVGGIILTAILLIVNYFYEFVEIEGGLTFYLLIVGIVFFYALAPDLDLANGKLKVISTILGLGIILFFALTDKTNELIIAVIILAILWILPLFRGFGHRGHYHSLLFGILLSAPLIFIRWELALVGFVSFWSHLWLDKIPFKFW